MDPLERLRDVETPGGPPDTAVIRARARRIRNRRNVALGSSAGMVALVLAAVVVVQPGVAPVPDRATLDTATSAPDSDQTRPEALSAPAPELSPQAGERASPPEPQPEAAGEVTSETLDSGESADVLTDGEPRLELRLGVEPARASPGQGVDLALTVCNPHDESLDAAFATAQRYDFEISRDGAGVWRWSTGRMFAQVMGTQRWEPGRCHVFEERWDGTDDAGQRVEPGSYEVTGVLTTKHPQRSDPAAVCVTGRTGLLRRPAC